LSLSCVPCSRCGASNNFTPFFLEGLSFFTRERLLLHRHVHVSNSATALCTSDATTSSVYTHTRPWFQPRNTGLRAGWASASRCRAEFNDSISGSNTQAHLFAHPSHHHGRSAMEATNFEVCRLKKDLGLQASVGTQSSECIFGPRSAAPYTVRRCCGTHTQGFIIPIVRLPAHPF
jgi:hypothetical protein